MLVKKMPRRIIRSLDRSVAIYNDINDPLFFENLQFASSDYEIFSDEWCDELKFPVINGKIIIPMYFNEYTCFTCVFELQNPNYDDRKFYKFFGYNFNLKFYRPGYYNLSYPFLYDSYNFKRYGYYASSVSEYVKNIEDLHLDNFEKQIKESCEKRIFNVPIRYKKHELEKIIFEKELITEEELPGKIVIVATNMVLFYNYFMRICKYLHDNKYPILHYNDFKTNSFIPYVDCSFADDDNYRDMSLFGLYKRYLEISDRMKH